MLSWARMRIKSAKSRSLSIRKGRQMASVSFKVAGERIPVLAEQPLRSLGREYTADLTDRHMAAAVTDQLKEGLKRIDQSYLSGKCKVWCNQFTLYQRVMWPMGVLARHWLLAASAVADGGVSEALVASSECCGRWWC